MKKLFIVLLAAFSTLVQAEAPSFDAVAKTVAQKLGVKVISVADAPMASPKLFQVSTDRGLFYVSQDMRYLVHGKVYDLSNEFKNVTEEAMAEIRNAGLSDLKASTIDFVAPNQKHEIYVFTDTSCGYCRKLHAEMDSYLEKGITVRYLAFPRGGPQSQTFTTMNNVWCAKDSAKAMTLAKNDDSVGTSSCKSPVAEHYQAGQQFGVTGTPAIVFPDGELVPGYIPADRLIMALENRG